jgi:hypothetical protein
MSRHRTRCAAIEERTLSIGFGIKGASQGKIGLPKYRALLPALNWREQIPFCPLFSHKFLRTQIGSTGLHGNLTVARATNSINSGNTSVVSGKLFAHSRSAEPSDAIAFFTHPMPSLATLPNGTPRANTKTLLQCAAEVRRGPSIKTLDDGRTETPLNSNND